MKPITKERIFFTALIGSLSVAMVGLFLEAPPDTSSLVFVGLVSYVLCAVVGAVYVIWTN